MNNSDKIVIGFAGRKRSGKGVLADIVCEKYGATKITIASYLKKFCAGLLGTDVDTMNRMKDDGTVLDLPFKPEWCQATADVTGIPLDDISKVCDGVVIRDVRHLLQFVGTDVIRRYVPTWHIDQAVNEIRNTDNRVFAVDDIRFPDELEKLECFWGHIFYIIRPGQTDISNHMSETSLLPMDFLPIHVLVNNRTLEQFKRDFSTIITDWMDVLMGKKVRTTEAYHKAFNALKVSEFDDDRSSVAMKELSLSVRERRQDGERIDLYRDIAKAVVNFNNGCYVTYKPSVRLSAEDLMHLDCIGEYQVFGVWLIKNPLAIELIKLYAE